MNLFISNAHMILFVVLCFSANVRPVIRSIVHVVETILVALSVERDVEHVKLAATKTGNNH